MNRIEVSCRGAELLRQPMLNKGSAFSVEERREFGLDGLLPSVVTTMEEQSKRVYGHIVRKDEPLERYIGLMALQDRNEHLFYRLLLEHLEEFLPIVYTPTVGQASKRFSHIFRRGRGLWITPDHRGRIGEVLRNHKASGIRLSVVTDNQAILGIGDQGAGGIVIPIGKLSIYCAAAGLHPAEVLPLSLDVGTDNQELLDDPLYMGWRRPRLRGEEYASLVEELVEAMAELYPGVLLQWEDFSKSNAFDLLERYRDRILSFNDDIQGTGAMTIAGLIAASRIGGRELADQRTVIVGGGAAGIGIAQQLRAALMTAGVEDDDLTRAIAVLDSRGLITTDRDRLDAYKTDLAWSPELAAAAGLGDDRSLGAVVGQLAPTVLIGTSGQPGLFSEKLVRAMAAKAERPIIFPLSNPTDHAEALPVDLVAWTEGRALIGTGSPFEPVEHDGREIHIGQGNNAFIFPGVGLGALVAGASSVTDGMFTAASEALADALTPAEIERSQLYPSVSRLREVTRRVAAAVVRQAGRDGVGKVMEPDRIDAELDAAMWTPEYPELVPV